MSPHSCLPVVSPTPSDVPPGRRPAPSDGSRVKLTDQCQRPAASSQPRDALQDVLWIDDEPLNALGLLMREHGFNVEWVTTGAGGLERAREKVYALVIVDVRLGDMLGLTLVERLARRARVLVVTGCYFEDEVRREACRLGAAAVAYKPFFDEHALAEAFRAVISGRGSSPLLHRVLNRPAFAGEGHSATPAGASHGGSVGDEVQGIVASSGAMREVMRWVAKAAPTDAVVLITGETGVGKELVAAAIHRSSARSASPFVTLNCASIPEALLQSELFGHRKGAFTSAGSDQTGVVAQAHHGTLFLDEIGDLPTTLQAHLLRFLETGEGRRLGDSRTTRFDVRVVAATNRRLSKDVAEGRFREDLYFRLAVLHCHIPPLRERREDIEPLVKFWLSAAAARMRSPVLAVSPEAMTALRAHDWPGNVRELRHVVERAVCFAAGDQLTVTDIVRALGPSRETDRPDVVRPAELDRLLNALEQHGGNRAKAALELGIDRTTLWRRLRRYGLNQRHE